MIKQLFLYLVFAISNANSFKRYKSNPGSDDEFHRESHVLTDIPGINKLQWLVSDIFLI